MLFGVSPRYGWDSIRVPVSAGGLDEAVGCVTVWVGCVNSGMFFPNRDLRACLRMCGCTTVRFVDWGRSDLDM